ncbi:pol II transcription elongation factor [Cryptococcus gattii E566]|uniref:Pol II transcription elongation factor, putative n=2 Tax=Cryptococcus gattii TaxID=37769 RepID=E6R4I7_CRYGW|nr:Pol II transcription elongation factor, putative [Cryptococcus gattii WM276]ADV21994.1 Pol II transcription elongation factor, putative [Cryptococcus gattii WM276]KIR80394.1 pol II transcription elongation factor [Cryptococcus gattii EJB2]KIY35769.1 pol II transcription elongation factor [Cryptococcus gattii E566]
MPAPRLLCPVIELTPLPPAVRALYAPPPAQSRHRTFCGKCRRPPASRILASLHTRPKKRKRPSPEDDDDDDLWSDSELVHILQGWVTCRRCVVASHYGCLSSSQKKTVLESLRAQDLAALGSTDPTVEVLDVPLRKTLAIGQETDFLCAKCTEGAPCFVCCKDQLQSNTPLLFRCLRCKQAAHYEHLKVPKSLGENAHLAEIAHTYQTQTDDGAAWTCHQCRESPWGIDIVIAWRPLPTTSPFHSLPPPPPKTPLYKTILPREYLIKYASRSFRHVTWVPHTWLSAIAPMKLRRFLEKGPILDLVTDETLEAKGDDMVMPSIADIDNLATLDEKRDVGRGKRVELIVDAEEDAESGLPVLWSTIDRVLDVLLIRPTAAQIKEKKKKKKKTQLQTVKRHQRRILSLSPSPSDDNDDAPFSPPNSTLAAAVAVKTKTKTPFEQLQADLDIPDGLRLPDDELIEIEEWEALTGRRLVETDVDEIAGLVGWGLFKWEDLQYDRACWDTPPPSSSPLYAAYKHGLFKYLAARRITIPVLTPTQIRARDNNTDDDVVAAARGRFVPPQEQPECIAGGTLMPFQMEGFQWLLYKYFKRESCILADDMGLGKTVQIASVLGYLGSAKYEIYPCLVVVPNSTITNWVREFEKWSPHLRVVPFYGEAASREIIFKYELFHKGLQGKPAGLKAHIVLTTYDMITSSEFRVFSAIPRWEVLCVDEGQRLKSDNSKIFNNLKTLNSVHRILLTGTPLNNNIRELFNLLNFLDQDSFKDLESMEQEYADLNEAKIQKLHQMIKPYILRRIKADVLNLPPKVEIIVPISLTPLQKQMYKGIFENHADIIQDILKARQKRRRAKKSVQSIPPTN